MSRTVAVGDRRGFTMIELMVVLVILSVGLVLVVPRFDGALAGLEIKGAARDLASGLRYARGRAIASGEPVGLFVDVEQGLYWIGDDARQRKLPGGIDLRMVTGTTEVVGDSVGAITFFPDGSATGGRLTLAAGQRRYRVDVQWLTGRVGITAGGGAGGDA
ncbi:GspH/FimT family pseudopilin [Thioalkalivibrio nitratireducens]|nr:GspH/FimT family pseudopilin [Thioalkalivibrio nitratireducens]